MWTFNISLLEVALRTLIVYAVVLVGIRLTGKREVGQMASFELVLILLLANAVQNAMTGPDTSLTGGVVGACTLLIANAIVTRVASRSRKLRTAIEGTPTVLILKGKIVKKNMEKEHIADEELEQVLREHGISTSEDVGIAVLEVDGSISVLKKDELPTIVRPHHRIRFIMKNKH
ncbi:MAG: YetF domain-containing protein [Bacteroidota bacterium]